MPINIEMPKLSDTMTEGKVVRWLKKEGDEIEIGDIIAEIETDKANMEMEAFDEGTLSQISVAEGEKAPVGSVIALLLDGNEEATPTPKTQTNPDPTPKANPNTPSSVTKALAEASAKLSSPTPAPATTSNERLKASPLARKIAAAENVDLHSLTGTGPGGRIVKADVLAAKDSTAPKTASPKSPSPKPNAPAPAAILPTTTENDQKIPLSGIRTIIADRLLTSKTTIPHFYLHLEVDASPLMALRQQINAQADATHGNKYSVNDFIVKALINASLAVPEVNASFAGDHIVQFSHVGIAIAIAVEDGLVTPVVKNAHQKSLLTISQEIKDLAVRARDKKLQPKEFDGGTITISNLGAWGIESFDAIINPPQAAILSVGAVIEKPVVKNGNIVPGQRLNLGLSCDHRVVDGAIGAKFLSEIKRLLENPALMLV